MKKENSERRTERKRQEKKQKKTEYINVEEKKNVIRLLRRN